MSLRCALLRTSVHIARRVLLIERNDRDRHGQYGYSNEGEPAPARHQTNIR